MTSGIVRNVERSSVLAKARMVSWHMVHSPQIALHCIASSIHCINLRDNWEAATCTGLNRLEVCSVRTHEERAKRWTQSSSPLSTIRIWAYDLNLIMLELQSYKIQKHHKTILTLCKGRSIPIDHSQTPSWGKNNP